MIESNKIELDEKDVNKLFKAYYNLTNMLETIFDKRILYEDEFIVGLDNSLKQVAQNKTKKVTNFSDFIS